MSDHFENKIREKLQDADFPFDQQAWAKMEEKLNALAPTHKRRSFLRWWWGGLILLLGVAGGITAWYNTNPQTEINAQQKTGEYVNKQTTPGSNIHSKTETTGVVTQDSIEESVDKPLISENSNDPQMINQWKKTETVNNQVVPGNNNTQVNEESNKASGNTTVTVSKTSTPSSAAATNTTTSANNAADKPGSKSGNEAVQKTNSYAQVDDDNNITAVKSKRISDLSTLNGNDKQITAAMLALLENINSVSPANIHIPDTLSTKTPELTTTTVENRLPEKQGWALGVAVGPDYSVAPGLRMGNFGVNAGLQLQYTFNNRWSVSTAAIYAKKIYGATKADYSSPYNFEKVEANCDVIDVPLNLNYTLFQSGKHSWSATVGASSYFMLKEDYKYYYRYSPPKKYSYQNENQHYFSVLNIGIGYQQQSARHVMWGIQPYAKIPMAGVGNGKVKLTSFGVMFHINLTQY